MWKKAEDNVDGEPPKSLDGHAIPKSFGDLITADHVVNLNPEEVSLDGDLHACIMGDKATYFMGCEPNPRKNCAGSVAALQRFLGPGEPEKVKLLYSDNSGELTKAARQLGIRHDTAIPDKPQTNGIAEAFVKRAKEGTSALLHQSGLEYGYWPQAMRCWAAAHNFFYKI